MPLWNDRIVFYLSLSSSDTTVRKLSGQRGGCFDDNTQTAAGIRLTRILIAQETSRFEWCQGPGLTCWFDDLIHLGWRRVTCL